MVRGESVEREGMGQAAARCGDGELDGDGGVGSKFEQPGGVEKEDGHQMPRVEAGAATYIAPPPFVPVRSSNRDKRGSFVPARGTSRDERGWGAVPFARPVLGLPSRFGERAGTKGPKISAGARERGSFIPVGGSNRDESVVLPRGQSLVPPR